MKHKNAPALLLALIMVFTCAVGCAGSTENSREDTTAATVENGSEETQPAGIRDSVPALDMGGKKFNILIRTEMEDEFLTSDTSDVIDEAVYNRNLKIEERFKCALDYTSINGNWTFAEQYKTTIRNSVVSGDGYDIVTGQSNIVQPLNFEGLFSNMLDTSYIDFSRPYWVSSYTEGMNLTGKVFTVCGDAALSAFNNANVLFFNKKIMTDYGIDYPYGNVLNGTWTLDMMLNLGKKVTSDIDGNGIVNEDDLIGFCAYNNSIQPFFSSCGFRYTETDSDGKRVLLNPSESLIDTADKLYDYTHSEAFFDAYKLDPAVGSTELAMLSRFKENKFMFMGMYLQFTENLRDMDVDFGILPYPKYDENQKDYYTTILRRYTVCAVPVTAENPDYCSAILEALSCEGYNEIVPKYYDIALNGKFFRDDDSHDMLDIVKKSLYLEFADLYYSDLDCISDFFGGYVLGATRGIYASSFESRRENIQARIDKFYEAD